MDKLETLHLFTDQRWQRCLETFLDDMSQELSHSALVDARTHLRLFFTQYPNPEAVDYEDVEAYCRQLTFYRRPPTNATAKRKRKMIRLFYDHAIACGIYPGPNPACLVEVEKPTVHTLFSDTRWQQCVDAFLQDLSHKSGSRDTVSSYAGTLERFFTIHPDPNAVSRSDVSQFIYANTNKPWSKSRTAPQTATINSRASHLRSFYNFASAFTITGPDGPSALFKAANPTIGFRHGKPARAYKSLSMDEIKRFFDCMSDESDVLQSRDRAIYWCYLLTCRRRAELAGLLWGQISFGTVTAQDGSMHQAWIFSFKNKGHSSEMDMQELPEKCMAEIRAYLELTGRWGHMKPTDPVFLATPNQYGGGNVPRGELRALKGTTIAKRLKMYAAQASIDQKKFSMHSLRHSGAYLRVLAGENLYSISRTLRHTSLATTTHYLEYLSCNADSGGKLVTDHLARYGIH